jgi:hypothetical protein
MRREVEVAGHALVIFGWACVPIFLWDWVRRHHP